MSENKRRLGSDLSRFVQIIDPKSWPAFIMFCVVLVAAGWLNYIAMTPVIGAFGAIVIALFFGFGVLSWHIVESRTDDSEYQEDIAGFVKWTNAGLDGSLIVLNLFRAELRQSAFAGMNWADAVAFAIIGASAVSHVTGYLLWTKNDPKRKLKKEGERDLYDVSQKRQRSENAIKSTMARAEALKYIVDQELEIRKTYGGVIPDWQIEELVKQMKVNALKDFEGLQVAPEEVEGAKKQEISPVIARLPHTRAVESERSTPPENNWEPTYHILRGTQPAPKPEEPRPMTNMERAMQPKQRKPIYRGDPIYFNAAIHTVIEGREVNLGEKLRAEENEHGDFILFEPNASDGFGIISADDLAVLRIGFPEKVPAVRRDNNNGHPTNQ